jgi:hypothetical protein
MFQARTIARIDDTIARLERAMEPDPYLVRIYELLREARGLGNITAADVYAAIAREKLA